MLTTRTSTVGEAGDMNASPGSREWALAVSLEIYAILNDVRGDAEHLDVMLTLFREHKGWQQLADRRGRPFASYEVFCVAPRPHGLGYRTEDIDRIIGERRDREARSRAVEAEPIEKHGGAREGAGRRAAEASSRAESIEGLPLFAAKKAPAPRAKNQPVVNRLIYGSTNADYLTARIARDRPDILQRMKAGEFPSVRKAAIEAGIVKPTIAVQLDPEAAGRILARHFKGDALERLLMAIAKYSWDAEKAEAPDA